MIAIRLLLSALMFGAVAFATLTVLKQIVPWWNKRTARYTAWIVAEHTRLRGPLELATAQRWLGAAVVGPAIAGAALGGLFPAVLFAGVGAAAPYAWMRYLDRSRRRQLDNQLIDALILMANGLKSGLSLFQAIELAADDIKPPLGDELSRLMNELRLGRLVDDALRELAARMEMPDLEIAVHSILTLRETGGNLSDTFMTVAHTIAERKKVEGRIQAITAQGVYQGVALCAMPFAFGAMFYLLDPEYMVPMFSTALGWIVWTVVIVLDALGMWMILKIVKIDV